jgi:(p)ppGpp synthase/HD superfamily hydrolase
MYKGMLDRAIIFATKAHEGQVDKVKAPYILHPLRVMLSDILSTMDPHEEITYRTIAVLHDVIEDTAVTEEFLRSHFPYYVIDAVVALTKVKGETLDDYYAKVKANPTAHLVKLADIDDNLDPVRLSKLDEGTRDRLKRKYEYALQVLRRD